MCGEQTPFDNFSATIDVNSGIVSSSDLLIKSNGFDVTGSGMLANLTDHSIAFNLVANVDESPATDERTYDIGGYSLPIACTGMLDHHAAYQTYSPYWLAPFALLSSAA